MTSFPVRRYGHTLLATALLGLALFIGAWVAAFKQYDPCDGVPANEPCRTQPGLDSRP